MSKYFTVKAPADTSFSSFRSILYQRQASLFTVSFKRTPDLSVDLLGQVPNNPRARAPFTLTGGVWRVTDRCGAHNR